MKRPIIWGLSLGVLGAIVGAVLASLAQSSAYHSTTTEDLMAGRNPAGEISTALYVIVGVGIGMICGFGLGTLGKRKESST